MSVIDIPVDQIVPNPDNIRKAMDSAGLEELAISIEHHGLLQPLVVNKQRDGKFTIIAGHRRFAAIQSLQDDTVTVPCIVRESADSEVTELMLVENIQREDLNPIDEATAYKMLCDSGLTQTEIARRVSKSISHISKRLSLLSLPDELQVAVSENRMTLQTANELAHVDHEFLDKFIKDSKNGHTIGHNKWDIDTAKRQSETKGKIDKIRAWLDGVEYRTKIDVSERLDYVGRHNADDLDDFLIGPDDVIKWDERSSFILVYRPTTDVDLSDIDEYERECERLDALYAEQMADYKERRATALRTFITDESAEIQRLVDIAIVDMLKDSWGTERLVTEVFGKYFPTPKEDSDDEPFALWLAQSRPNVHWATALYGLNVSNGEDAILEKHGIFKPERPVYPDDPSDTSDESDDDEYFDDESDDGYIIDDDSVDDDIRYEGTEVAYYDE